MKNLSISATSLTVFPELGNNLNLNLNMDDGTHPDQNSSNINEDQLALIEYAQARIKSKKKFK